jgi:hypothetical protein
MAVSYRAVPASQETQRVSRKELDDYCRPLVGGELTSLERRDWTWFIGFGPDTMIATEDLWRLISNGRIVATSEDHGQWFGRPSPVDAGSQVLALVRGGTVTAAAIAPSTGDLAISFGGRTLIQFVQTSSGYESWRLSVPGSETICVGGGEIVRVAR